jgi:opacity protein-like surface antigen
MRTIALCFLALLLAATNVAAQAPAENPAPPPASNPGRVTAFAGYSYFNTNLSSVGRASTYGWEVSGEVKLYRWVSVAGDIDTHYGSQGFPICQTFPTSGATCSTFTADFIERNFLVGPRVSVPVGNGAFRPYVEVLVGGAHVNAGVYAGTDNSFAAAVGGGVDFKITRRVGWRFEGDYIRTQFFSARQDNGRFSTGPVFHF